MDNVYVICGFSGVGKSTAEQKSKNVVDFESSAYSHFFDDNHLMCEKNPNFPRNYIDALCESIDKGRENVYLISCHEEVRKELTNRGINYIIVMPSADQKNDYLKRWLTRGSSVEFIAMMDERWEEMHRSCESDNSPKIYLDSYEYISDVLPM